MNTKEINLYHHAINNILTSKYRKDALHIFKNKLDYKILCQVADGISSTFKPLNFTIYGSPLPKTIEDLGKADTLFKPESVENELKWVFLTIRKYSNKISIFILLKSEFEKYFLLGDYLKAENILESIINEIGYSLWYIEAKFLLLEYQNKSEEQKEFLSHINEQNKNGVVSTLSQFLSFRTERNLSAYKYDSDIDSIFKGKTDSDSRNYYLFRLNFYENYLNSDYSTTILFENCNSIVDRYLLMLNVLKALSLNPSTREMVYTKARYLYRKINDPNLLSMLYMYNPKTSVSDYYNENYLRILDLYYSGLYNEAISECKLFLLQDPSNFDVIVIYAYCHINLKKEVSYVIEESKSVLNQLIIKIFELLSSKAVPKDLIYNLYQINKNILSFDLSSSIDYFLKKEQNLPVDKNLKWLSIRYFDPYFSSFYETDEYAVNYLNNGLNTFNNSISIKHRMNYINNLLTDETKIAKELYSIDKAKILFNKKQYNLSIREWEVIVQDYSHNSPIIQIALKYWFESLFKLNQYNEAIALYVDNYISNPNSVSKINPNEILDYLRDNRYRGVKRVIDLPIFVTLNSSDDTEKSFILEQYCKILGNTKPSEIFNMMLLENLNKVELFFNTVCVPETLKHSIYINNTIELLSERLQIINFLIEYFPENKKMYHDELNLISNELIIYEGTQKLEDSKIYANDQAIINNELNEIEGLFNRFKTLYKLSLKDKKILIISQNSYALFKYDGKEKFNETDVKFSDSALSEVFRELFDSILDKYLFSKFGIVAYLSTRIRHGVLLGEIRPVIEKHNLILSKIGNSNTYEESKYWNKSSFDLNILQKGKLHRILSGFSLKIDNLIEEILRQKIQIRKDGKNKSGLFNYEFDKIELYQYALELAPERDVKMFAQKVIDLIWKRTDANLEVIRHYFNDEVKENFFGELNSLEKELYKEFPSGELPEIFTNLVGCSTIIENKINKISSWFRRSGSSIEDFDIQRLFTIVWNSTEKCYPKVDAGCELDIKVNPKIKSNYYIHFSDLFRIFLDNMFKYGKERDLRKSIKFESTGDDKNVIFRFSNFKNEGESEVPLKRNSDGKLIININKLVEERKSGISKAIKIIQYDLGDENNFIRLLTEDPEKFVIEVVINVQNLICNEEDINS